jgi:hypothetical protein
MFMLRLVQEMSARRYKCLGTLDMSLQRRWERVHVVSHNQFRFE